MAKKYNQTMHVSSFDVNNKKGATKSNTKTKSNKPRNKNNNAFRRYVLYIFVVVIIFLPPYYLHLDYLPTKESSEIGHGPPPRSQQPTIIEQHLESFKNNNTTTTTSQQSQQQSLQQSQQQSQHDDPTTAQILAHTDITTNVVDIKKENDISTTTATMSTANHNNLVLTAYLEPPGSVFLTEKRKEDDNIVLIRNTSASILRSVTFPDTNNCSTLMQNFPIDNFPLEDPYLPWIHDYFHSLDGKYIQFVAQNRRKCDTGVDHIQTMKFWEPQVSLFQKIPIVVEEITTTVQQQNQTAGIAAAATARTTTETNYRLATSFQEATHNATRFQCRFHHGNITITTLSVFPFDYEFVTWRKGEHSMYDTKGRDNGLFWLSQLMFSCPVPSEFQSLLLLQSSESESESSTTTTANIKNNNNNDNNKAFYEQPALYVDLIPIRTPPRQKDYLLTYEQTGLKKFKTSEKIDLTELFGSKYVIPPIDDAGRWQNLPICRRHDRRHNFDSHERVQNQKLSTINAKTNHSAIKREEKPYRLVACTWTSSSYSRRGDEDNISDSAQRLREWIQFHLMVGVDHLYIYDNTDTATRNGTLSDVYSVVKSFNTDRLTYHAWPCKVCNNNRPAHKSPGERSSQYAAESSCRERYGELTEWLTFIDTDEYMVPMKQNKDGEYNWYPVLDEMDSMSINIMKFRSSRGKPRIELTENLEDQSVCVDPKKVEKRKANITTEPCVGPMRNKTFLQVYNCEYIPPPKPDRFKRAMKQIYRPSYVLSHYVHYSTVTTDMDQSYSSFKLIYPDKEYMANIHKHNKHWEKKNPEMFMDETQGVLVHTRSVLPLETTRRSGECRVGSKFSCTMGFLCEDDVKFVDDLHQDNIFHNADGSYCNCWNNKVIEEILVPNLEALLF